jgi:hypothetical protein
MSIYLASFPLFLLTYKAWFGVPSQFRAFKTAAGLARHLFIAKAGRT